MIRRHYTCLCLGFYLFLLSSALSQTCRYSVNEVDKFTGQLVRTTRPEKVLSTFYTGGSFSVKRVDSAFALILDFTISSYSRVDLYSISKGSELILLLTDGGKVSLQAADEIRGSKWTMIGLPPVYYCELKNVSYPLTRAQLDQLLRTELATVRFYRRAPSGKEDPVDTEIKPNNRDDLQELIRCVL